MASPLPHNPLAQQLEGLANAKLDELEAAVIRGVVEHVGGGETLSPELAVQEWMRIVVLRGLRSKFKAEANRSRLRLPLDEV